MAKIYGCKTETLYPYKHFGLDQRNCSAADTYPEVIGNLNIKDFKFSLYNKLPTQEKVDKFNNENIHKTGKNLTIDQL